LFRLTSKVARELLDRPTDFFSPTVMANAPGSGTTTAIVIFVAVKSTLGTAALDSTGHATLAISNAPSGSIATVTATYDGDTNFTDQHRQYGSNRHRTPGEQYNYDADFVARSVEFRSAGGRSQPS
jgi:hypothetical protein